MVAELVKTEPINVKRAARVLKSISHPARIQIVELLLERGPLPVKEIYESVSISQSNASQHLKLLEDAGVLISERDGKQIYYRAANPNTARLIACVSAFSES
jgi:ArsR family transcriptional regulator